MDRILVVEDNRADSRWLERLIRQIEPDAEVVPVDTVAAAEQQLRSDRPDAVITDLNLLDSEGLDTVRRLAATVATVPLVVMTGAGFDDLGTSAIDAGADDYLTKGTFGVAELERVLRLAIERKQAQLETIESARTDSLTGLANRSNFEATLITAAARSEAGQRQAVMMIDLDGFKAVNDLHGHSAGDSVLVQVSERIRESLRPSDTVARLGGDEFAVILADIETEEEIVGAARRLRAAIGRPYRVSEDLDVEVTASIGIARVDGSAAEPGDYLRHADAAMYAARRERADYRIHEATFSSRGDSPSVGPDPRAIALDQLVTRFQPIAELSSGTVGGYETLCRWEHSDLGLLDPAQVLAASPNSAELETIDRAALEHTCENYRRLRLDDAPGPECLFLVVINPLAWKREMAPFVLEVLESHSVAAGTLCLAIRESGFFALTEPVIDQIHRLRRGGVKIAIDDFAQHAVPLRALGRCPFDLIRINESILNRPDDTALRAIAGLAQALSIPTIAAGIETAKQATEVGNLGYKFGQGSYYGEPEH